MFTLYALVDYFIGHFVVLPCKFPHVYPDQQPCWYDVITSVNQGAWVGLCLYILLDYEISFVF